MFLSADTVPDAIPVTICQRTKGVLYIKHKDEIIIIIKIIKQPIRAWLSG